MIFLLGCFEASSERYHTNLKQNKKIDYNYYENKYAYNFHKYLPHKYVEKGRMKHVSIGRFITLGCYSTLALAFESACSVITNLAHLYHSLPTKH